MQRKGGIQFIPSDKPDPYLGGREYGHLFDDSSDEVIVKFGEVQVFFVVDINESLLILIFQSRPHFIRQWGKRRWNIENHSYEKFVGAVKSFKDFTLAWFKSTWKTMNLMMAIMPTTLLGILPIGLLLTQSGSITPAELAMGIILSLSIVGPLMKATTFINEAKSMEYA